MTNNRLNIGLFICHLDNEYANEICKGAEYAAKELDVNLIVFPGMFLNASFNDPENEIYDYQYNSVFYYAKKENLDVPQSDAGAAGGARSAPGGGHPVQHRSPGGQDREVHRPQRQRQVHCGYPRRP